MSSLGYLPVLCACAVSLAAAELPRIVYSKSFPKSTPAYVEVSLDRNGQAEYKEEADDEHPLKFRLTQRETDEIFSLAEKLERFKRPLESNLKVAQTGVKTFRYENGPEKNEVKFNYSLDADARLIQDWFERITETQRHLINLERAAKYDRLGVHEALLRLEVSKERERLVAPQQFLPILNLIARNDRYLHMARERAARLADAFTAYE